MGQQNKIVFLEYLRVYAFVVVLITHKLRWVYEPPTSWGAVGDLWRAFSRVVLDGGAGVTVFFLVSGYIIASVALRERTLSFIVRRVFRIYPLYMLAVVLQAILLNGQLPPWDELWPRLSLLGDYLPGTAQMLYGVDWTLRIEIEFYAIMAIATRVPTSYLKWVAPVVILACLILPGIPGAWNEGNYGRHNAFMPILMAGMTLYLFETGKIGWRWLVAVVVAAAVVAVLRSGAGRTLDWPTAAFGSALFGLAWWFRERFQPTRLVLWLASLTYAVYLFHAWFIGYVQQFVGERPLGMLIALVVLFSVCALVARFYEAPVNRLGKWLSGFTSRRPIPA